MVTGRAGMAFISLKQREQQTVMFKGGPLNIDPISKPYLG